MKSYTNKLRIMCACAALLATNQVVGISLAWGPTQETGSHSKKQTSSYEETKTNEQLSKVSWSLAEVKAAAPQAHTTSAKHKAKSERPIPQQYNHEKCCGCLCELTAETHNAITCNHCHHKVFCKECYNAMRTALTVEEKSGTEHPYALNKNNPTLINGKEYFPGIIEGTEDNVLWRLDSSIKKLDKDGDYIQTGWWMIQLPTCPLCRVKL